MGNILLEGKNLLTENIPEDIREKSILDFGEMHKVALKASDEFYALEELYGNMDAPIYRYFCSWNEFLSKGYSTGVSLGAWQVLQEVFVSRPNLKSIGSVEQFWEQPEPLAAGGFKRPDVDKNMVVDVTTWRRWRENWFSAHQDTVNWDGIDENCFFVNGDVITEILAEENKKFITQKLSKSGCAMVTDALIDDYFNGKAACHIDKDLTKGLKDNAVAIFFHSFVMNSFSPDGERQGYAKEIGSLICRSNYYVELDDLESMEKEASSTGRNNTQRTIFGFKMSSGKWKFISIDFEKGMFEFHDDDGAHLGEFRFDGSKNADARVDHSLRCVENWKRMRDER